MPVFYKSAAVNIDLAVDRDKELRPALKKALVESIKRNDILPDDD